MPSYKGSRLYNKEHCINSCNVIRVQGIYRQKITFRSLEKLTTKTLKSENSFHKHVFIPFDIILFFFIMNVPVICRSKILKPFVSGVWSI